MMDKVRFVPSSLRAYGHACPWSYGATRSHASHRERDYLIGCGQHCSCQIQRVCTEPVKKFGFVKTHPATSLTMSLTKAVRLLRWPLVRETRGLTTRGVVFYITTKTRSKSQPNCPSSAKFCSPEGGKQAEILHEVRRGWCFQRTWPLLMPTIRPERAGASFAIFDDGLFVDRKGCWWLSENGI